VESAGRRWQLSQTSSLSRVRREWSAPLSTLTGTHLDVHKYSSLELRRKSFPRSLSLPFSLSLSHSLYLLLLFSFLSSSPPLSFTHTRLSGKRCVHQTLTVRSLLDEDSVIVEGPPSTQDSWFAGFAWSIAHCSHCFSHLGWMYSSVIEQSRHRGNDDEDENMEEEDSLSSSSGGSSINRQPIVVGPDDSRSMPSSFW
jgi:hypothetical protein